MKFAVLDERKWRWGFALKRFAKAARRVGGAASDWSGPDCGFAAGFVVQSVIERAMACLVARSLIDCELCVVSLAASLSSFDPPLEDEIGGAGQTDLLERAVLLLEIDFQDVAALDLNTDRRGELMEPRGN
jgi:hypothetical protein